MTLERWQRYLVSRLLCEAFQTVIRHSLKPLALLEFFSEEKGLLIRK